MNINFIEAQKQNKKIIKELENSIKNVIESGKYILGENVNKFEEEFSAYITSKYAIGCASGTDALLLSLMAIDIKPNDEIITTPFTFISTANVISRLHAKPVFVDIDETFNINPNLIEEKITEKTKAIIPVHLFGQPANMKKINEIAKKHNLKVIVDSCQALGAEYNNKKAGSIGDTGCFSFFPTKNIGAIGDGGIVTTNNEELYNKIKKLRTHGFYKRYHSDTIGLNSRLDELQAAILRVKLKYLDQWNEKRIKLAKIYDEQLKNLVQIPKKIDNIKHVYNQYSIITEKRDELKSFLENKGIQTMIYYPLPLYNQICFKDLRYSKENFINSENIHKKILSLPIFPELNEEDILKICEEIKIFFNN